MSKTSKKTLVVANAEDAIIDSNGNLVSVNIHYTSSQGPADDCRIKSDITGNGMTLFSSLSTADDAYATYSGTSMASPNVVGSLLLIQQHYHNLNSQYMRRATLKGLALHTADDAGVTGPDALYGWGLLNTKKAAETISVDGGNAKILELNLQNGQSYQTTFTSDNINHLIASISWTDPPSYNLTTIPNDTTPKLVNDLDIRITQNGTTYYPWKLTGVTTNALGDNIVDPFELIDLPNASGSYTITITHKGSLYNNSQNFSLIITGILDTQSDCVATIPENFHADNINSDKVDSFRRIL